MKIVIPEDCKTVHVLFSGGVDSTILLYLLLLEKQNRGELDIICYGLQMSKHGAQYLRCQQILNVLEEKFNTKIPFRTFTQKFILRKFVERLLSVNNGCVFSGCNKVLDVLNPTNYIPGDTPPVRGNPFNEFHVRPFIDMDKKQIISYYIQYDIKDLFNLTYSCGFNQQTPCGDCYFCLEREWGIMHSKLLQG
jgi:7-cyano-7-deazaguanine synthase in queuosine biosynthesis